VAISVCLILCLSPVSGVECKWSTTSPIKASFDLSSLVSPNPQGYIQEDDVDDFAQNYLYHFTICNPLAEKPPINQPSTASCKNGSYSAYQITNNTRNGATIKCRALGTVDSLTWKLIETDNEGVILQQNYSGGESERFLVVTFKCGKQLLVEFSPVVELNTRQYYLTVTSIHACPLECPIVDGVVCGGHGVCGVDHDIPSLRCFCNLGKEGTSCSEDITVSKSHANGVLTAFVIILLILLLVLAGILYKKIKKLNSDATRYQTLQADDKQQVAPPPTSSSSSSSSNKNDDARQPRGGGGNVNDPPADVDD